MPFLSEPNARERKIKQADHLVLHEVDDQSLGDADTCAVTRLMNKTERSLIVLEIYAACIEERCRTLARMAVADFVSADTTTGQQPIK